MRQWDRQRLKQARLADPSGQPEVQFLLRWEKGEPEAEQGSQSAETIAPFFWLVAREMWLLDWLASAEAAWNRFSTAEPDTRDWFQFGGEYLVLVGKRAQFEATASTQSIRYSDWPRLRAGRGHEWPPVFRRFVVLVLSMDRRLPVSDFWEGQEIDIRPRIRWSQEEIKGLLAQRGWPADTHKDTYHPRRSQMPGGTLPFGGAIEHQRLLESALEALYKPA